MGILHRDLKVENILVQENPKYAGEYLMKIGDFGLSKIFDIKINGLSIIDKLLSQKLGAALNNPVESIKLEDIIDE
jgi:serine/threonine protein kinase